MKTVRLVLVGGFLGAGKTTTIAALARRLHSRGEKVAVITNDQGSSLVDTVRMEAEGLAVREVAGACFCCRFDELAARCAELVEAEQPDVILAEPVGSCTDLAATVVNPMRRLLGDLFQVGPLVALFRPSHGLAILRGGPGALTADVAYVLRKQLEEADVVAINRIDELPFPLVDEISGLLCGRFPGRPVLRMSAATGQGLDELLAEIDSFRPGHRATMDVDYDRYARGEAELGWLNASSDATTRTAFAVDRLLLEFVEEVRRRAAAAGRAIAHLKVSAKTPRGTVIASVVDTDRPARLSTRAVGESATAALTINARVVADPEWIEATVRDALRTVAAGHGVDTTWFGVESFRPARPQPTHREAAAAPRKARSSPPGTSRRQFLQATSGAAAGAVLGGAAPGMSQAGEPVAATATTAATAPFTESELRATGPARTFTGDALSEIAFPLGGIGTGTVSLGGRGQLRDWEIFNRPNKGRMLPSTFVTAWVKQGAKPAKVRVVEAASPPPYPGGFGAFRDTGQGLPHLREATFGGTYPIAEIAFEDRALPVRLSLEAFTPFIPHETDDSSLPLAVFRYHVENVSSAPAEVTLAFTMLNPVGYDGQSAFLNDRFPGAGQNFTRVREEGPIAGLEMLSSKYGREDVRSGSVALVTTSREYSARRAWKAGRRDESYRSWIEELKATGRVADPQEPPPTPDGFTNLSSLAPRITVAPGERRSVEFLLAWHFPLRENYWDKDPKVKGQRLRNDYATRFASAWEVAKYAADNLARLEGGTRAFRDALTGGTLPAPVVDAVSSQASILRSNTCLLLEGKQFFGFEGVQDQAGCCPMNCTHVWNYEQTLAFLFPDLERSMRRTDFLANMREDGSMAFRTLVPVGTAVWDFKPSADGQLGCVLKLYREWQISGDAAFLAELWPAAKRALEFAWKYWDADKDGVIEGEQHVTYDVEFYGANSMVGTLYLGALAAAERMARAVGDTRAAAEYRRVYTSGREKLDRDLWRDGYYVQRIPADPKMAPTGEGSTVGDNVGWHTPAVGPDGVIYQYGDGCLSDQLLGQWFAHVVGLGYLLPEAHVREALRSVFRHNFRQDFAEYENTQRLFALDDEGGLLICSWPRGGRPALPFRHWEEVWTGIEYQVAAHLIYEGDVTEGLTIVRAVRDRYDGQRRNPWNEVECGSHYARALASWSLLTALSGFSWSAPERRLAFAPRLPGDFKSFFATGGAWGTVSLAGATGRIDVIHGELPVARLGLPGLSGRAPRVRMKAGPLRAKVDKGDIVFAPPVVIRAGDVLQVG